MNFINSGSKSETGSIRKLLLKHPKDAFVSQSRIDSQWKSLNYTAPPDYNLAMNEYDEFVMLLEKTSPEIHYLPFDENTGLDSIYTCDAMVMTEKGAILCSMGKEARSGEPGVSGNFLESIGIPVLGSITGAGRLEGGDVVWLNDKTLAAGLGYRTNREGIDQLKKLTADQIDELIVVPLPHWNGPSDVLHLMSNISPVDANLAVVYSRLLTVQFRNRLLELGIKLIEVPDVEYDSMACNVLAVAPRKCIMLAGNPVTKKRLEDEGAEVFEYAGNEISRKGAGGPTCLTRPLVRDKER